jgi:NADH-quinone oxidoreductase subunit B
MSVVAPAPKGILDPRTGKPVGADDAFFRGVNAELSDKGFLSPPPTIWSPGRVLAR